MKYSIVLFDLDYTLGDATGGILQCFRFALREMHLGDYSDDTLRNTIGHTLEDSFTIVTGVREPEERERFRMLYSQKADQIMEKALRLYPDTLNLLSGLDKMGCTMAVVSTRPVQRLEVMLKHVHARAYFKELIGVDSVPRAKPDPAGILMALSRLQAPPEQAVYIGDTVIDAEAAQRAGVDFIAVCTGTTKAGAFAGFPCRLVAANLGEVAAFLNIPLLKGE